MAERPFGPVLPLPLLALRCECGALLWRHWSAGLLIADGQVIMREDFAEMCQACGREYAAGAVLAMELLP